ncbi:hypothetical protein EBB07_23000 [Paenibacillaceae bacterium]|nr:hypothetical protein EBB07_23000 [Paenibacillaceae bacterium]
MYAAGNINVAHHLNFKTYLINHPEEAKAYGELKIHLAKQSPDDVHIYQNGKEAFCNELMSKAMKWASEREDNKDGQ